MHSRCWMWGCLPAAGTPDRYEAALAALTQASQGASHCCQAAVTGMAWNATWQHCALGTDKAQHTAATLQLLPSKHSGSQEPATPDRALPSMLSTTFSPGAKEEEPRALAPSRHRLKVYSLPGVWLSPVLPTLACLIKRRPDRQVPCSSLSGPAQSRCCRHQAAALGCGKPAAAAGWPCLAGIGMAQLSLGWLPTVAALEQQLRQQR